MKSKSMAALATLCFRLPKDSNSGSLLRIISPTLAQHPSRISRVDLGYLCKAYEHSCPPNLIPVIEKRSSELLDTLQAKELSSILPFLQKYSPSSALISSLILRLQSNPAETRELCLFASRSTDSSALSLIESKFIEIKHSLTPKDMTMILSAYGKHYPSSSIFPDLEQSILSLKLDSQGLASVLYWYAKSYPSSQLFDSLLPMIYDRKFNTQELVNLYTAFSITEKWSVLPYLESEISKISHLLTPQGVANLMDAGARTGRSVLFNQLSAKIRSDGVPKYMTHLVHAVMIAHSLSKFDSNLDIVHSVISYLVSESNTKTNLDKLLNTDLEIRKYSPQLAILCMSSCKAGMPFPHVLKQKLLSCADALIPKHLINISLYLSRPEFYNPADWEILLPLIEKLDEIENPSEIVQIRNIFTNLNKQPEDN